MGLLTACGGGGSSTPAATTGAGFGAPAPGVTTYALQAGFKALTSAGSSVNFVVSGGCTGTATTARGVGRASSFEGITGFSTTLAGTLTLPNCIDQTSTLNGTAYYDSNYAPLGSLDSSGAYSSIVGSPLALPERVKVGDSALVYVVYNAYSDSTKTTRTGQTVEGFSITADTASPSPTANTAIYDAIIKSYDVNNTLQSTQHTYYRMQPDGTLTLLSLEVIFNSTLVQRLLYTPVN